MTDQQAPLDHRAHVQPSAAATTARPAVGASTSSFVRALWVAAGTIFLGVGIAGIILPLLPGAVFLLIASACYLRGSERLHHWLINHKVLGHHVKVMTGAVKMQIGRAHV